MKRKMRKISNKKVLVFFSMALICFISCDSSSDDGNQVLTDIKVNIDQPAGSVIPQSFTGSIEYGISDKIFDGSKKYKIQAYLKSADENYMFNNSVSLNSQQGEEKFFFEITNDGLPADVTKPYNLFFNIIEVDGETETVLETSENFVYKENSLTGSYEGHLSSGYDMLVIFQHYGDLLVGTMYIDVDHDDDYYSADDETVGMTASVDGADVKMTLNGSGIVFSTGKEYAGTAKVFGDNLKITCDYHRADNDAINGDFNLSRIGTGKIKGTIDASSVAAPADNLFGKEYQVTLMFNLSAGEDGSCLTIEGSWPASGTILDYEIDKVAEGSYQVVAIIDNDGHFNGPETGDVFGIYSLTSEQTITALSGWNSDPDYDLTYIDNVYVVAEETLSGIDISVGLVP